jgi:hypothetical protein
VNGNKFNNHNYHANSYNHHHHYNNGQYHENQKHCHNNNNNGNFNDRYSRKKSGTFRTSYSSGNGDESAVSATTAVNSTTGAVTNVGLTKKLKYAGADGNSSNS